MITQIPDDLISYHQINILSSQRKLIPKMTKNLWIILKTKKEDVDLGKDLQWRLQILCLNQRRNDEHWALQLEKNTTTVWASTCVTTIGLVGNSDQQN